MQFFIFRKIFNWIPQSIALEIYLKWKEGNGLLSSKTPVCRILNHVISIVMHEITSSKFNNYRDLNCTYNHIYNYNYMYYLYL